MARVINSFLGDLRGKVGGVVFSANKSGSILRKRVQGHNPKTAAQTAARQKFASGSGGWDGLTSAQQGYYNEFAKSGFKPFKKLNKGNRTGAQAYRSCSNVVQNAIAKYIVTAFKHGTGPEVALVHTDTMPAIDPNGPVASVSGTIENGVGSYKFLSISGATLTAAGALRFDLNFDPSSPAFAGTQFIDANGIDFGLTAYASAKVKKEGSSVSNKTFYNLGFTGIPDFTPVSLSGFNQIHVSWDCSSLIANFKAFPGAGKSIYLTVAVVGSNGTISKIGELFITLT
jgi:hypothetical protein